MIKTPILETYSYGNSNIPVDVFTLQKKVFDKFNLPIKQVEGNLPHGVFLTETAKACNSKYIIFFDIDCIPLTPDIYNIIISELEKEKCIIGIEQKCNCNPYDHIYAGPACLAFSTELYREIGCPSLVENTRSDVGEELTWACEEKNINVKFFNASSSEIPKWKLTGNRNFGIGTTYSHNDVDVLYHQFEIRKSDDNFITKCKSILS